MQATCQCGGHNRGSVLAVLTKASCPVVLYVMMLYTGDNSKKKQQRFLFVKKVCAALHAGDDGGVSDIDGWYNTIEDAKRDYSRDVRH